MNDPAPATVSPVAKRFPLTPGAIWDTHPTVVWSEVSPASQFGRGAAALHLRRTLRPNRTLIVKTTCEELALLIAWSWSHP